MSEHDQMHNAEALGPKLSSKELVEDKISSTNINIQSIVEQSRNPSDNIVNKDLSKKSN